MKTSTLILLLLMCVISLTAQESNSLHLQNSNSVFALKKEQTKAFHSQNWYERASKEILEQELQVKWKNTLQQYVAVNRNNHLGFFFKENGYRILSFSTAEKESQNWEFNFDLEAISRGNNRLVVNSGARATQTGKQLSFEHPQYAIEYLNDAHGMRQNFIINERPSGNGKLEIAIRLDGQLKADVEEAKRLVLYADLDGKRTTKMLYDGLKAWDKNNTALTAGMELRDEGRTLIISVNDEKAQYPITVDPLNHTPDWTDNGLGVLPSLDVLYGNSVSDAGDVNNDGFDDIIIGAPGNIDVLSGTVIASVGQAFIYLGSSSGPAATPSITLQSSTTINGLFGFSVSSAGDINNDGYDDVIVGAPADQVTLNFGIPFGSLSNNVGKVYVYYGNATPASIPGSVVNIHLQTSDFNPLTFALTLNPLYGFSVSGAGDVNNDGYDDIIVGSPVYTDLGTLTLAGRATVYLGSGSGLNTASPIHRNAGLLANSLFGFSVSSAGDMNNDGADEVLIGAPGSLTLLPGLTGKAYVYQGIPVPTTGGISSSAVTYSSGGLLKTLFGYSVSNAGDVNNDGFKDIIVGEPATLDLTALVTVGKACIFYGGATLSNKSSADITLQSPRDPDILGLAAGNLLFGFSVSGGRDLDCDGIADVIVGEPGGTAIAGLAGINAAGGQSYTFFGKNITGPTSDWRWQLKETGSLVVADLLGSSVSIAGDVNGDGNQDILVGASNGTLDLTSLLGGLINYTFVQSIGSAYVHFGCLSPQLFTLPVNISSFNGYLNNNVSVLKWQTATEQNTSHFEVERSVNSSSFEKIGSVFAKGNSNTNTEYGFVDNDPSEGNNAYRLKTVSRDGKTTYSTIVNIKLRSSNGSVRSWSVAGSNKINIQFFNTKQGDYVIEVFSLNGSLQYQSRINVPSHNSTLTIDPGSALSSGMYIIKLRNINTADRYHDKVVIR